MNLSIVIPCYNEEKNIENTHSRLDAIMKEYSHEHTGFSYEIIFVNDGSRDKTVQLLEAAARRDTCVKYISFSRNFGKEAGMLAGLTYASGDAVTIIDADLQHPPEMIPQMIDAYNEGYDQVIARRDRKGDARAKSLLARMYYVLVNKLVDVHLVDGAGDFRLLSRKAVDAVLSLPENNRFSKGIFSWIGFKEKQIEYENITRENGESKWSFRQLMQYGIDGVLSFNNKPLRLMITVGTILLLVSLIYIIIMLVLICLHGIDTPGYFTLISAIMIIGGVQLLSLGVIGEYVGRIYYETKRRPNFIVDKTNIELEK